MLCPHRGDLVPLTSNDQSPTSEPVNSAAPARLEPTPEEVALGGSTAPAENVTVPTPVLSAVESSQPVSDGESALGDTAGTGTIIALGCITGTIFLIIVGLIYLLITQVFG